MFSAWLQYGFILLSLISLLSLAESKITAKGQYRMPAPSELSEYSVFETTSTVENSPSGKAESILYQLPEDLAGPEVFFKLLKSVHHASGFQEYRAQNAIASCLWQDSTYYCCLIRYDRLPHSPAQVSDFLRKKYGDSEETDLRVQVARLFSNNPHGILQVDP